MNNIKIITEYLERVKTDSISEQAAKNIRASGASASELQVQSSENEGQLTGDKFRWSIHGRKPGKQPPSEAILQWIQSKGITPEGISQRSLAFLIARKIARQGTDIAEGKKPGVDIKGIAAKHLPFLKESILRTSALTLITKIRATKQ